MNFPSCEEYVEFHSVVSPKIGESTKRHAKENYRAVIRRYNSPEEIFALSEDDMRGVRLSNVMVFLAIKLKIPMGKKVNFLPIYKAENIIRHYNMADEEFIYLCKQWMGKNSSCEKYLLSSIVRMFLFLGKNNVKELTYEDIDKLNCRDFNNQSTIRRSFLVNFENIYGIYTGKAMPQKKFVHHKNKLTDLDVYGIQCNNITIHLKNYIENEYTLNGYHEKNPLKAIKTFFNWIAINYPEVDDLNKISREYWQKYKIFIHDSNYSKATKRSKINDIIRLLEWLVAKKILREHITEFGENAGISVREVAADTKSRFYNSREDFIILLAAIYNFKPKDEKEELIKHMMLITSATGLRAGEVVWLGPKCLISENGNVGEILLQVQEKLGTMNKITSIYEWGISSIKNLIERFENRKKIKFYHKRAKQYFYSLFEYEGKLLSTNVAYQYLKGIIEDITVWDDEYKSACFKGAKFHGMRHQKGSDIMSVSGGSLFAVKFDLGHQAIEMARIYTKQEMKKRQGEAYKLIDEGRIVGKGADILKAMLATPYAPESYVEIVKKMNTSARQNGDKKEIVKYLGFGYCGVKQCKLEPVCESCDCFFTCETFKDDLKDRYAQNFAISISRINHITKDKSGYQDNIITGLKYQEKWLKELGVTDEDIMEMRTKYIRE